MIFLLAYLLGSIPFGFLLARAAGMGDIRAIGSGNIGATNVLRSGHRALAAGTLALDMLKGAGAVWFARILAPASPDLALCAGFAAMIGHIFPIWLGFRGGKGVATGIGTFLALHPVFGLGVGAVWLAAFGVSRISSVAALAAFATAPLWAAWISGPHTAVYALVALGLVIFTHRANIQRLLHGTEHRFRRNR